MLPISNGDCLENPLGKSLSGSWDGKDIVFPGTEVVAATCIAGRQWARSWWLL